MQRSIGQHTISYEPPWIIHFCPRGSILAEDMLAFGAFVEEMGSGQPFVLGLGEIDALEAIPAGARKIAAQVVGRFPWRGMALFGGSFQARIFVKLVLGSLSLLGPQSDNPIRFFEREDKARAWLTQRGHELDAASGGARPPAPDPGDTRS